MMAAAGAAAAQGTVFIGTWPHTLQIIDEARQKVVDKIELATGLPHDLEISADRKTLFIATLEQSGFEVFDIATRKVTNTVTLNESDKKFRISAWAPDPQGTQIYILYRTIEKKIDRYDVDRTTRFAVIDLAQKRIVRTGSVPKDEDQPGFGFGGTMRFSPDGKYLYIFRDAVYIFDSADFRLIEKIDLAKPDEPGMMNIGIGRALDSIEQPGVLVSVFNSQDPVVHRNIFGIARFDLTNRTFHFDPVGPATTGMVGLHVTPDGKKGIRSRSTAREERAAANFGSSI